MKYIVSFQYLPKGADRDGRVRSRLFQYFGKDRCRINIVVEEDDGEGWGKVIKE